MNILSGNKKPISGFKYFICGLTSCFTKEYRRYLWLPIIVDFFIWLALWFVGVHYFSSFMDKINHWLPAWLHWLDVFFWVMYLMVFLIFGAYLFTLIANILLAPFLSLLAESVQNSYLDKTVPNISWKKMPGLVVRSISREMRKIVYFIPWIIVLGFLFIIPGVNIIASLCWFLFGSWMQSLQYFDYCADQNNKTFKQLKIFMSNNKFTSLSFGAAVMLALMIPILNVFVAPAAVIGATRLALDLGLEQNQ